MEANVQVHLVDGTYELFRHFYAVPGRVGSDGSEIGATRAVVDNVLRLLEGGATHVGVATDHVIESFRNDLYAGYKTGIGVDPSLRSQFGPLEEALTALGVVVWPEVRFEADDALGAAAAVADVDPRVDVVLILTPDKDLAQCVRDPKVVQVDRRANRRLDEAAVREKFGVPPTLIPDYLALVGDSADGYPGIAGFGAKTAAALLRRYGGIEAIPAAPGEWDLPGLRGAQRLAATLQADLADALLFRDLATIRVVGPQVGGVDDWWWRGPTEALDEWAARLGLPALPSRAADLAGRRGGGTGPLGS
jgi:5'-3' exonuclease